MAAYGNSSAIPTEEFFYGLTPGKPVVVTVEPGVETIVELHDIGGPDDAGMRTLYLRVNGQPRPVSVRDNSIAPASTAARRADPGDPAQIPAGLPGLVTYTVTVGDHVGQGDRLATIEAMKMEAAVTSPHPGTVVELLRSSGVSVEVGDLLLVVTPDPATG